jgi:hypothetical protein
MTPAIAPIVEGKAEVESVPILLRRILAGLPGASDIQVARPFRVPRNRIVRPGELERALAQVVRDRAGVGAILVVIDADDDPPAELAERLLDRCRKGTRLPAQVTVATRELEAWFLGAKESLRGVRGIRSDAAPPPDPEAIRGAKERLTRNMSSRRYLEVDDQPAFAARMDLSLARQRCASFDMFVRGVQRLVSETERAQQ